MKLTSYTPKSGIICWHDKASNYLMYSQRDGFSQAHDLMAEGAGTGNGVNEVQSRFLYQRKRERDKQEVLLP